MIAGHEDVINQRQPSGSIAIPSTAFRA